MAGTKALNVRMNFQVDTTQARQQIQQLGAQLNSITKASNFSANSSLGITQEILQATKAAAQLKATLAEAINPLTGNLNLSAFNDQLIASKMSLMDYRNQLSALGTVGNQTFNSLTRSIMTAETPLLRTGKAAQQMWTVLGNTVRWQATSSMIHGIMGTASQAMNYVKSLDSSLNSIRIVTGQNQAQMERFAQTANKAAKDLNTTTNAYAKASLIYYQQGLSNEEVEKRVATTVKLANVSGQTAAKVSDQLTAIWNNFYDGSKSLEYYADVMTALGASTASSTDEIAKGLEKFSSIAKTTGLSYEYATSALSTVVAATRQSADSVGTSFKTLFSRLQGLSLGETLDDGTTLNKYSKALDVIGVNIKNANGSLKDMDRILDEIGDKWTTLSKAEQVALAQTVGGARNYTGLVSLMDNWDSFQTNLKTAQQAQGTLQNQADIYAQSWEAASNHVRVASETIYKNLLDDKFFKGMTNMFGYMLDGIGEVTNQMGGFKGVMSGLANFAFTTFAPQISKSFANIGSSIYGFTPQGQERVLDLRKQAMNAVTANVRLSEYGAVDKLAHDYNQAFVNRQVAYDNAVQKGRVSEYQTPVYQTLLTNMGQQEDAMIRQAETYYRNEAATNLLAGRQATIANTAISRYNNVNLSNWQDKTLQAQINAYRTAFTREENAAGLLQYYRGEGTYGIQAKNMAQAANGLQRIALGAKALGQDLDKTLPGLSKFHTDLEALGGDVTKLDSEKLKGLLDENTMIGKYLSGAARRSDDEGTVQSAVMLDKIEQSITERLNLDLETNEGKETLNKVMAAVTAKDLNISERAALLQKAGLTEQQQRGILGDIEGQTVPQTIAMSSALSTNIGMLASLGQMYTGVSNAIKTFGDENATAGQQVASLTSLAMAGSMAFKPFSNFIATAGKEVTIFGKGLGMTNGILGATMAGIAAAAVVTSAVVKDLHKNSLSGAIENYNTALATSTQLASNAKNAYDQLITSSETHNNLLTNIQSLRQGTQEFTLALLDANDAANNIIENHDLIYGQDYTYNQQGAIEFKEGVIDKTIEQAEAEMIRTSVGRQQLAYSKQILDTSADNSKAVKKEGYNRTYTDNLLEFLAPNGEYANNSLQSLITQLNERLINDSGIASFVFNEQGKNGHWQFNRGYEDWLQNEFQWVNGSHLTEEGLNQLQEILGTENQETTVNKIHELLDIAQDGNLTNEDINAYLGENYISQREFKNRAAIQGLVDVTISGVQDTIKNSDLVSTIVANSLMQGEMATDIAKIVNQESIKTFFANGENDPKEWYKKLYGKDPEGLSEDELYSYVAEGLTNEIILHGGSSDVLKGADSILNTLKGFDGILAVAEDLDNLNLPNLENLNYQQITEQFDALLDTTHEFGQSRILDTDKNRAIQESRDYAKQIYDNQLNDLSTAMLRGIGDGLLNGVTETEDSSIFKERVTALAGQITDNGKEIMASLTYGALKQATNAMINANEVGESTANTMYSLLLRGRTQNGGFDADTLAAIQNYNLDNTIASIYSNNNLKRYAANQAQRDKYIELFSSQIEDIGKEKGWFQMLYNSSGFSDVLDKINSQFQSTGQITAQYITDLAGKSEELSQFLKVSSDNAGLLSVNAGGLAAIFEEMNKGTSGLTSTNISSDFISAVSRAESRSAANASAFEVVDNLDLGRSGLDFLDYFQDMGKEMYQANKAGWGFYSDPIQNIIDKIGGSRVREAYMEANSHADWNFQQMWNFMKTDERSAGFMTFMESMAGKKGKGGGGPADVMKYLFDTLGGAGFADEDWNKLGFRVDSKGGFYLREGSDGSKEYTQDQLVKNLTNLLMTDYGWTEEDANNYAQVIMSTASTSGQVGQALDQRGAQAGFKDLLNGPITQEEYDAYFRRYGALMGFTDDNEKTGREKFEEAFRAGGGSIGLNLQRDEWQGVTSLKDLAERSNKQGVTYTQNGEVYTIGGTGSATMDILQLANAYGAAVVGENGQLTGQLDYNKLLTMVETMGGTEEDLIKMLENDQDTVQKLVAKTASGEDISWTGEGTVRDWVKDVHAAQGDTVFKYSGLSQEAADMAYMYEHMVMSQNEDGTWSWHYETQEDRDKKAAEEQHKADVAKRQQLKEQFGYSDNDIDEAIVLGSDYDTLINNAQTAEDQKKKEEERRAQQETTIASNKTNYDILKNQYGWSDDRISGALEAGNTYEDLITVAETQKQQQEEKADLERRADVLNLTTDQVQEYDQLRADLGESSINIDTYKAYQAYKEANPEYEGSWMDWHDAGMPKAKTENPPINAEYVGEKVEEKVDTLTPDDRSLGERWADFTQGIGNGLKTVAGTVIGAIFNPFGVKAEADIEEGKEAPFGNKPEAITDDTYNPTLGMTFGEWKAQKAQQEQQLQQAQLEQESQRQAWQNYQDALSAENDFLAENGDFVTNPENAKLAAWTAAARENPELLGALYQNALKERYTGDQFTQMYDYQGLHGATQSALSTAVGSIFNSKGVTAQQRFDFINNAYEKAQKDITSLTPFEKQVLTMISEIDEHTGTLVEHGEEEDDAATRAKKNGQVNEEGELVDEEGNPLEMPGTTQPQGGGTGGGRDSGGGGSGGGGSGGGGSGWSPGNFMGALAGINNGSFRFGDLIAAGAATGLSDAQIGVLAQAQSDADKAADYDSWYENYVANASGQNNARLLAYASGKEGHIAITGELGPELRVKSDGSMDILGKTGREYAWVEPTDRIYTASQSAGILKSNKIPGLEGLAKGINNFIPGYEIGADWNNSGSSGGGSSGGGGRSRGGGGASAEKDPRYDPQTLKIRDILERYYTILQQIDNITKAVERFSKVADRAWGRERIRAIEQQNEMQQKQYEAQKKYIAEIEEYLDTDQSALTTMIQEFVTGWNEAAESNEEMEKISWTGAQYDENGVLTNYREFVEKLTEQYNQNAASANKEAQYKFQEQLKDIQMYTDTLNLYEEQKDALEDIKNAILDTAVKAISYEVEYKLELSGDADRILNFQADKYKDDVYQAAKYLELLDKKADETRKNLVSVQDGIFKTLGTYAGEAMRTGAMHDLEELGIYGTEQFKLDEELTDADEEETEEARLDRLRKVSTKVNEWLEQLREKNADAAAEIDKMITHSEEEGQEDIITNYEEVIRRLNAQVDYTAARAKVDEWLEELRGKNAEAAAEIDKIVQRNEAGEIINYRDVIERLNEENVRLSDEAIAVLMEDQDKFFEWMSDFRSNPGWVDFTTEHKDLLTNYMDQIYQYLQSLQETYEQTIEQLGDSIKATAKQMDAAIDEFDYYGDVYKTFGNIVDLTNRHMTDVSQEFFDTLNNKSMDNAINKIKGTVTNYHLLQNELAEVTKQYNEMQARANAATGEEQIYLQQSADKLKEQLDIANSQYEDAHKAFLSSWEDALSKMAENYKAAVEEASRNFEQGFSPLFNTLALLQAQFDREKALGDLYVDNYQRIHDLNKLNRDIQLSIDDTDNLKGKERLRDLQAEINQLQEDGTELSEYDLDILDKKYRLELARQALEDAKDAKSMVRLARDNNGNWSYVYTANQDDVEKAEQDYEDAIREMEQANEDYIDNIQDQILQVQQEAQQAILALQPEDFATYEDYLAAVNNIQNSMYQTLDFLRLQLNNAFGNNEWLDPYIVDRYGVNDHDLTTDFGDTTLAGLLDNPDVDKAMKKAKQNFEDTLKKPVLDAFIEYSERQDEVYKAAEHDIATIGKDFQDEMESIADSSDYQVEVVENLSQRVQDAFNDMAAVVDEKTKKHLDEVDELVNRYEKLVEALTEVKRLSGENLPAGMTQEIGTTDTWREIEDLENLLKENGHIRVLEDLTNLNKEDVVYRDEKLKDATEKIDEWVAALGDATAEIAEGIKRNDAGQITNYKDIVQKLAGIEQTDENKETLKNIKKWKEKDDASVLMDDHQVLTDEGLWTYLVAGDDYTKQYLKDKIDNAAKNGAIDVGADVDETEKAKVEDYLKLHGIVYVKWDGGLEKFESMDDWLAWYEKHKYVPPASDGGGGNTPWTVGGFNQHWLDQNFSGGYIDTGGYTGRWQSADTGMYTGEWPGGSIRRNGRLAWLHQKELILNAHDTENFLDAMKIVRQLDNLTNWMANGLGDLIMPNVQTENSELEQNVHIEAEFPNVTNHNEIEQAFNNLVNMASQYANRK